MKKQLKAYFNRYLTFDDAEIDAIYASLTQKTFKKRAFLLEKGNVCKHNFFILKGVVRAFHIDDKGKEQITLFAIDDWWVTNMESFIKEIPSYQYIQAVEDTSVLCLSKNTLEELYIKFPKLERLFRIITENMLIANLRKNDLFLQLKSKERYYDFIEKQPAFAQRVPQYMIASYLEITPEYLSELRRNSK